MTKSQTPKPKAVPTKTEDASDNDWLEDTVEPTEDTPTEATTAPTETQKETIIPPTAYAVLGRDPQDRVELKAIIYKNTAALRSISVWHLQRRLSEWGHSQGYGDRSGYYGDPTKEAVQAFQAAHGLQATGHIDADTLTRVFEGDTNVTVHLT